MVGCAFVDHRSFDFHFYLGMMIQFDYCNMFKINGFDSHTHEDANFEVAIVHYILMT